MGKLPSYRIISAQAKDLYEATQTNPKVGYSIKKEDSQTGDLEYNLDKFNMIIESSLDLMELSAKFDRLARRKFLINTKDKENFYTDAIVDVGFDFSCKEYNSCSSGVYVKYGYPQEGIYKKLKNSLLLEDGEIKAIQVKKKANKLADLPDNPYFKKVEIVDKGKLLYQYELINSFGNFKSVKTLEALRKHLYENGFKLNGYEYVRYKRSSGSSRVGNCLFIRKECYNYMMSWSNCGLDIEGKELDLAGWESYIALSLSNIESTVNIPLDSILLIDEDKHASTFFDKIAVVKDKKCEEKENKYTLETKVEEKFEITNSVWDGQSLLDSSLFTGDVAEKGMVLLRNKFFKSCAFNTNLQKYFKDNGIESISQLKGVTLAKDIKDIKLVTTKSSIKYFKYCDGMSDLDVLKKWTENITSVFGIVKSEKPPKSWEGRMVRTSYQILNTVNLNNDDMRVFLEPSIKFRRALKRDLPVFRYYLHQCAEGGLKDEEGISSRTDIAFELLKVNDNVQYTRFFNEVRNTVVRDEKKKKMMKGDIFVDGTYATLFGNGPAMLQATISDTLSNIIEKGEVYTKRFECGDELFCARSPHITMGNIYIPKNIYGSEKAKFIDKYFNLTNEIVCINSFGENTLYRLNGADFDSDTMLITNNPILLENAKKYYDNFLVPTEQVQKNNKKAKREPIELAKLDHKTSNNKIGEIVNFSQELNSLYWDKLNKGETDNLDEIYLDICKLAVLSNVEIDSAKREFIITTGSELQTLREKYKNSFNELPLFFKTLHSLNEGKGIGNYENKKYKKYLTSMDELTQILGEENLRNGKGKSKNLTFAVLQRPLTKEEIAKRSGNDKTISATIVSFVGDVKSELDSYVCDFDEKSSGLKKYILTKRRECKQEASEHIRRSVKGKAHTMKWVLEVVDAECNSKISNLLVEILFFGKNSTFYDLLERNTKEKDYIVPVEEDEIGDVELFNKWYKVISEK